MLRILRLSTRPAPIWDSIGDALLNLSFLRLGFARSTAVEGLSDHLRRDVGLPPRARSAQDPRDLHW